MTDHRLMTCEEYQEVRRFYSRRGGCFLSSALLLLSRFHEDVWSYRMKTSAETAALHRLMAKATSWEDMEKFIWRREEAAADEAFLRRVTAAFEACMPPKESKEQLRQRIDAIMAKYRSNRPHPPLRPEEYFDALDYFMKRDDEVYQGLRDMESKYSAVWLRPEDPAASFEALHVILACLTSWDDIQRIFRRPPGGVMEDHELRYRVSLGLLGPGFGLGQCDSLSLPDDYRHMEALQARFEPQVQARVRAREAEARALQAKIKEWTREREARQDA